MYNEDRCKAFQCDLTKNPLTDNIQSPMVDIVTMIFVLSAIHPEKMPEAIQNIFSVSLITLYFNILMISIFMSVQLVNGLLVLGLTQLLLAMSVSADNNL